jgi:cation diffusion facilitator CzcD-associated flavoprotein CzcO
VWTERYAGQPEILRYANHVADRFDLRRDIVLDARVTDAIWDESHQRWVVSVNHEPTISAQFCIFASGALSAAKRPEVDGLERFAGSDYHTGRWPSEPVDFTDQLVGVIGTGSSGIQSIPIIAEQAKQLYVFQRTPNYSSPARNRPLTAAEVASVKAEYPARRSKARLTSGGLPVDPPTMSALEVDPDARERHLEEQWANSTLLSLRSSYNDVLTDPRANEIVADFARSKIRAVVKDASLADRLCPSTFPYGAKRPCLDTNYYQTFNRENVEVVDLRETPIVEITKKGILTTGAEYELDVIVLATGFDSLTGPMLSVNIQGRNGQQLRDKWAQGPRTYLGVSVASFPNLFMITGPQSPSVLSNMLVSIEQHVEWIADFIDEMRAQHIPAVEPTEDAEAAWNDHCQQTAARTLYPLAASSYTGANVVGKPRGLLPYAGGVGTYRLICSEVANNGYAGFATTEGSPRARPSELNQLFASVTT